MASKYTRVSNNIEKSDAYKVQMSRLKQAREQGFYFEAVFILYAMLEDRLSSFLFHAGLINQARNKITTNKIIKPCLEEILLDLPKNNRNMAKISNKMLITQAIFKWSKNPEILSSNMAQKDYRSILYQQLNRCAGEGEMILTLDKILDWCQTRNELVHALLNKNIANQEESLRALTEEGYSLARQLDNFVRSFKVRNSIRKQFNIQ
jgi:hypothetical protein